MLSKEEIKRIEELCKEYNIKNYTILPDGRLDVDENVNLYSKGLKKLPLSFRKVGGNFDCSNNQLTSLDGGPKEVGGSFYCYNNQLTSLDGSPEEVGGWFNYSHNKKEFTDEDVKNAMDRRKNLRLIKERVEFLKEFLDGEL